jgi:dUTP pyrophosphatase
MYYIKINQEASISRAHEGDAGYDLVATSITGTVDGKWIYGTGVAVAIPFGFVGLLVPRSSIIKKEAILSNSIGIIDSGYRGEVRAVFTADSAPYELGERCCQLVIVPCYLAEPKEVQSLEESSRGSNGFGSTGR